MFSYKGIGESMNRKVIYTIIFATIVIIDGLMSFSYYDMLFSLLFEVSCGLALLFSIYLYRKNKKLALFILPSIVLILTIYFGYNFSNTTNFHTGIMTIISAFFVFSLSAEIVDYYRNIDKK